VDIRTGFGMASLLLAEAVLVRTGMPRIQIMVAAIMLVTAGVFLAPVMNRLAGRNADGTQIEA
jgi:hypothetical protein